MKNTERARYAALTQAEIRSLYQANPTKQMRRLVWEIYCLHVVAKTACAVVRAHRMRDQLIPGGFEHVLKELEDVLQAETYVRENLPSLHIIKEKRRFRYSTKKRNQRVFRRD